jgi:predicted O-methyltransferase YrrM
MRHFRPRRIVEVGSGFSTAAMLDTIDRDPALGSTKITCIEPYSKRLRWLLRKQDSEGRVTVIDDVVQTVEPKFFESLEENDILFIDSSHCAKVGSDVNHLFFEVLPRLRPGVLIQVHDIGYPFEYPKSWILSGRSWNEAYLLRAFLQFNDRFALVLWMAGIKMVTMIHEQSAVPRWIAETMPRCIESSGMSLWMRRRS